MRITNKEGMPKSHVMAICDGAKPSCCKYSGKYSSNGKRFPIKKNMFHFRASDLNENVGNLHILANYVLLIVREFYNGGYKEFE